MAIVKETTHQKTGKLSNFSKTKLKYKDSVVSESDSSYDESVVPSLTVLKISGRQKQVDKRLYQLEEASASTSGQNDFKSKRGGNIDCGVRYRVAWPQDTILRGHHIKE